MTTAIIGLQAGLAVVLAVAGFAKLRDLPGSRQAVRDFGVPKPIAAPLGTALPFVELIIAAMLLFGDTASVAALAAAVLFLAFIIAIGVNLRQGRQPDCHCFGQLHSEPAGWSTIARNGALTLVTVPIVATGGRSPGAWFGDLSTEGQVGVLVGIGILGALAVQARYSQMLVRQNNALLERIDTLAGTVAGDPVPAAALSLASERARMAYDFDVPAVDGGRLTLHGLLKLGKPVLVLFMSPTCGPCNALLPDIGEWSRRFAPDMTIAVISTGSADDNRAKTVAHGIPFVGLQSWPEVSEPYGVIATPTGVLVDPDEYIRQPNANGRNEIRGLVARTIDHSPAPPPAWARGPLDYNTDGSVAESVFPDPSRALAIGAPVPRLPLPDPEGHYISLEDFRGQPFMLLFWNTNCGFCQRLLPDIRDWETEMGDTSPRLVFASAGTPEAVRDLGVRSTVLLDDELAAISKAFGAPGTPSAVLIDAHGRIASDIMIGSDAILDALDGQVPLVTAPDPIEDRQSVTTAS